MIFFFTFQTCWKISRFVFLHQSVSDVWCAVRAVRAHTGRHQCGRHRAPALACRCGSSFATVRLQAKVWAAVKFLTQTFQRTALENVGHADDHGAQTGNADRNQSAVYLSLIDLFYFSFTTYENQSEEAMDPPANVREHIIKKYEEIKLVLCQKALICAVCKNCNDLRNKRKISRTHKAVWFDILWFVSV